MSASGSIRLEEEGSSAPNRDGRDLVGGPARSHGLSFPALTTRSSTPRGRTWTPSPARERALAISALCLAAAWKQPRGLVTVTTPRYDDGRRQLPTTPGAAVPRGRHPLQRRRDPRRGAGLHCGDVFDARSRAGASARLPRPALRPRRATTRATSSVTTSSRAWRPTGATRRSCGRPARASCASATRPSGPSGPSGPHSIGCSSIFAPRAAPGRLLRLQRGPRRHRARSAARSPSPQAIRRIEIPHRYAFGTHRAAGRRVATEYIFVAS